MSKIEGMDELQKTLTQLEKSAGKFSSSAYIAGGKLVEGDAKKSIQNVSTGKMVTRYRNGGGSYDHQASSENNAPNTDTGRLVGSINTEPTKAGVFVGTTVEYGKYLEFGTSEMGERPWLMPAIDGRKEDIVSLQIQAINKSIRGAASGS